MELFVRSESVVSRLIAGETLIVPIRKGVGDLASIYSLNQVGSAIWAAIATPNSKSDIVQQVAEEFSAERPRIENDVEAFLAELESAGLAMAVGVAAPR
jgi:hypothetical protein